MKNLIYICLLLLVFLSNANAQTNCPSGSQEECTITFSYSTNAGKGNRESRTTVCSCVTGSRLANPANNQTANSETTQQDLTAAQGASIASLYPNPTGGSVKVTFDGMVQNGTLLVSDAMGKQLAQFTITGTEYTLDLSTLPAGMYYILLKTDAAAESRKVVKTN